MNRTFLSVMARSGIGTLAVANGAANKMKIRGRSMKATVESGIWVKSFSFEIERERGIQRGVIALEIETRKTGTIFTLVPVLKQDSILTVNLDELFVPDPGRLGQVFENGRIEVRIGNIIYTNDEPDDISKPHLEYRLVDINSLCEYMVSIINAEELESRSSEYIFALTKSEKLAEMRRTFYSMEEKVFKLETENAELKSTIACLDEELQELQPVSARLPSYMIEFERLRTIQHRRGLLVTKLRNSFRGFFGKLFMPKSVSTFMWDYEKVPVDVDME